MGTVSVIPTRAALSIGFAQSTAALIQNCDPVKLISSSKSEQEQFVAETVKDLLQNIDVSNPYRTVLQEAAKANLEAMLKGAATRFEHDKSDASQNQIRKKWCDEIPARIDSIRSIATTPYKKERNKSELVGEVAPLITKRLLLQRFAQAAAHLRAADIRDFHNLPDIAQHGYVENIVRVMTEGATLPEHKTINLYQTLHDNILEVSDLVRRPPYSQATRLMSDEALRRKAEIGEWASNYILSERRSPKF